MCSHSLKRITRDYLAERKAMHDPLNLPEPKPDIRVRHVVTNQAVIQSQRRLTHDTDELVVALRPGSTPMRAHAGQFATIKFPGIQRPRPYSFARDPNSEGPGNFTFYIRQVVGGEVSAWLASGNRSGAAVEISGPLGNFGLDQSLDPMLCVAGGSGISAIVALLEFAATKQVRRDCYFYYGARTSNDLYCEDVIDAIAKQWHADARFQFVQVLSEEPSLTDWEGSRRFVTDAVNNDLIISQALAPNETSVFFCGPPPMIAAGTTMLVNSGLSSQRIFCDAFEDARSPAPVIDNRKCVLCDECLLVKPVSNCIVETAGLEFDKTGNVSRVNPVNPAHSSGLYYNTLFIDENACIRCYACVNACPHGAISPEYSVAKSLRQKKPASVS
jgi:NAD(P)H-flavin reductase